jgi:hypothetical protein
LSARDTSGLGGAPEQRRAHRVATAGALAGLAALLSGGIALWRRRHAPIDPHGEESGRGLPGTPPAPEAVRQGFEPEDDSGRGLAKGLSWLVAGAALAIGLMFAMLGWFHHLDHSWPVLTAEQTAPLPPPAPRLQARPFQELRELGARQNGLVDSYRWLDAAHDRARVPVVRAMPLLVGHGLDERAGGGS